MFNNYNDSIDERGFIDKNKILEYVTEEQIFKLVFGFEPKEFEYVISPFRQDTSPGCFFERERSSGGSLRFVDFGNPAIVKGIKMSNIDCFNAVMIYYGLPNFYKTLLFIKETLIDGKNLKKLPLKKNITNNSKLKPELFVSTRSFDIRDKIFWSKYKISSKHLMEDRVFPIKEFKLLNSRYGNSISKLNEIAYVYTNFPSGNKKIYFPEREGSGRFLSTCGANDIGEMDSLPSNSDLLIITKSYKDCRVIKNQGYNSIWIQNEGMIPSDEILTNLSIRFSKIIVLYDNDETGINSSYKMSNYINSFYPNKSSSLVLPEYLIEEGIKDPSDLIAKKGEKELIKFLKENEI